MANQDVGIRIIGEDKASGTIRNVQSALGGLEKSTSGVSGAFGVLGQAASVAAGFIIAQIGTQAVSAVSNLTKEMINLTLEAQRFQSQTANILKNLNLSSAVDQVNAMVTSMEEMTGISDEKLQQSFNDFVAVTKDVTKAREAMNLAADISAAKNIDMATSTKLVMQAMAGDVGMLKRYGIYLNETAMETMNADQKFRHFKETIESTIGGAAEAYRNSTAGIFENFNNQLDNLKKAFGAGLVDALAPALENISTKIYELLESGKLQPLIESFGTLAKNLVEAGEKTWDLTKALLGVEDDAEAIQRITTIFDALGDAINLAADGLERLSELINNFNAKNLEIVMGSSLYKPGTGYGVGDLLRMGKEQKENEDNTETKKGEADTGQLVIDTNLEQVNAQRRLTNETMLMEKYQKLMSDTTTETTPEIGKLGTTAAGAVDYIQEALSSMGGGGGCGGGSCLPTCDKYGFTTTTTISDGHSSTDTPNMTGNHIVPVPDALITKRGDIVKFHPNDNILAYQDPSALKGSMKGGGSNISVNITVNGSGDPDRVAELIMRKIERIGRL